ncbi:MAG: carbon storage regulator [Verrucomicrobia bacterium]|nr:carbon storage regulator [Verrucomicrobiota bacterium]
MLVLARKVGETVVIDEEIIITVLKVHGKSIYLGIKAPPDKRIYRGELLDQKISGKVDYEEITIEI